MAVWLRWIIVLEILSMFAAHQCGSQWTLGAQLRSESGHLAIKGGIFGSGLSGAGAGSTGLVKFKELVTYQTNTVQ